MNPVDAVFLGFFGLVVVVVLVVTFVPRSTASSAEAANRFAATCGLALLPEVEQVVVRRLRAQRQWTSVCGLVSVILVIVVIWRWQPLFNGPFSGFISCGIAAVGGSIGNAGAALLDGRRRDTGSVRLARSTAVTLEDYVSREDRLRARGSVGLVVVMFGVLAIARVAAISLVAVAVLAAASVMALGFFEVAGRRIAGRRQIAHTSTRLAWDDAFRASDLTAIAQAVTTVAAYGIAIAIVILALAIWGQEAFSPAMLVVVGVAIVGWIVSSRWTPRRHRHYLRRLWRATAAEGEARSRPRRPRRPLG